MQNNRMFTREETKETPKNMAETKKGAAALCYLRRDKAGKLLVLGPVTLVALTPEAAKDGLGWGEGIVETERFQRCTVVTDGDEEENEVQIFDDLLLAAQAVESGQRTECPFSLVVKLEDGRKVEII
jgi:hypothetical protein